MEACSSRPLKAFKIILMLVVLGLPCAGALPVFAQAEQPAPPAPTAAPAPTPMAASEIPARSGELKSAMRTFESLAEPETAVTNIIGALPGELDRIRDFDAQVKPLLDADGPSEVLRDAVTEAVMIEDRLSKYLAILEGRAAEFDAALAEIKRERELWQSTLDGSAEAELPPVFVQEIRQALDLIGSVEKKIVTRRVQVLTLQIQVAEQQGQVRIVQQRLQSEIEEWKWDLWRLDSPPLWKALMLGSAGEGLGGQVLGTLRKNTDIVVGYVTDNAERLILHLVVFTVLLTLFIRLGRRAAHWSKTDESLRATAALLQRPASSSLLVTIIVLGGWIHPKGPIAVLNLVAFVLLMTMLRLLPQIVRREMIPAVAMLVGLVGLFLLVDLIPSTYLLDRLGKLLLTVLGTGACFWILRQARRSDPPRRNFWFRAVKWSAKIAAVFFAVSAAANIVGALALADLLATATLSAAYDAIILWVFVNVLFGAVTVALRTPTARKLLTVRYHDERIRAVAFRLIRVVAVLTWAGLALHEFGVLDAFQHVFKGVFFYEITIGSFSISVSDVVVFFVVVWLARKIAQFTAFVLDEDVLSRIELPRGAAPAISKMSQYVVLAVGVLIAVAAAGLDVSQLTLVVGALGVGIGFGLQNVVNNFVSGLILLFERPVNLGDRIEVGEISGVVRDIGIRASVVRSWQGADVIVPNASLISDNLINWTLTDQLRRMEIQVNLSYGTSPATGIELLLAVAHEHPEVLDDPQPVALFTGFGDSSLNFELRAWTVGDFVGVASDLRVSIDRVLADNGITIPFPQRDLHLRSVDERAAETIDGKSVADPAERGSGKPSASSPDVAEARDAGSDEA